MFESVETFDYETVTDFVVLRNAIKRLRERVSLLETTANIADFSKNTILQAREDRIKQLSMALSDCMNYVDVDNLTMQAKYKRWKDVLGGKRFDKSNVEVET